MITLKECAEDRKGKLHNGTHRCMMLLLINVTVILLIFIAMTAIAPIASVFGFVPLSGLHWLIVIGLSIVPILVAEYEKNAGLSKAKGRGKESCCAYALRMTSLLRMHSVFIFYLS